MYSIPRSLRQEGAEVPFDTNTWFAFPAAVEAYAEVLEA